MRLSACFLSCLLSNPQTAAALQRNTRPSTHDAARPVYGQETVRPIPLPQYRAGKVSFFLFIFVKTTTRQYDNVQRLSGLELLIFPVQKKANPSSFFCLPGHYYCRILAFFLDPDERGRIYFMVKREFFSCGTSAGNHKRARCGHLPRSSSQSEKRIRFILPAREFSHIIESLKIKTEPDVELIINLTH